MPESWRSFSLSFLTRWGVQCLFLPWEAESSLEPGREQFTKQADDESKRRRVGMHYLNTYSHLPAPAELLGHGTPSQFIVLTKQKSAVVWGKTHPQKLFCHQLPPHLYFILAGSSTAQVFPGTCTLPALGLLQWLHLLGKNSPKLGQQMRCLEVEAIAKHLYLFISSLAPDLANNH